MNCFAEVPQGSVCPVCGWDSDRPPREDCLPPERMLSGRYLVGRAKFRNSEGVTYAALDGQSRQVVEIREFFPRPLAMRREDGTVGPADPRYTGAYQQLRHAFLELSMSVSRLRELPQVPAVREIFEENETAYAVYEYVPAVSLRRFVQDAGGKLTWKQTEELFSPVLTALGLANSLGVAHLGISPETLRVRADGTMFLFGFALEEARRTGAGLEPELADGCAALEQYRRGQVCGEASDVYAFAACMVFALTGRLPKAAPQREEDPRLMMDRETLRTLPSYVVSALANALQVQAATRTPSFERLKLELSDTPTVVDHIEETQAIRRLPSMKQAMPRHRGLPPVVWLLGSLVVTLVILTAIAGRWLESQGMSFSDLGKLFEKQGASQTVELAPDLINQPYEVWASRNQVLLRVSDRVFSDTVQEGNIISQSPLAGETLEPGEPILVTVSKGPRLRPLPPFEGVAFEELEKRLTDNGFVVEWAQEPSETVEEGVAMGYQGHLPGDTVEVGSTVTVVVSSGP